MQSCAIIQDENAKISGVTSSETSKVHQKTRYSRSHSSVNLVTVHTVTRFSGNSFSQIFMYTSPMDILHVQKNTCTALCIVVRGYDLSSL